MDRFAMIVAYDSYMAKYSIYVGVGEEHMKKIENIAIIGMGALGVMFGNLFAKKLGNQAVTFIADDSRIERYRAEGVYCNGKKCEFTFANGKNPKKPADLLIFAVKGTALDQAIEQARQLVGEDTVILSLLNGIVSEELIGAALGNQHVLYCVAQGMDAVKFGNELTYAHFGQICIGILSTEPEKQPLLQRTLVLFDDVGMPYTVDTDIKRRLWGKWMLNVGVNQVVMVERGTYGTIQQPGKARDMMIGAMREVIMLAKREGVDLTEEDLNGYVRLMDTLSPTGMPSMRQDGIEKRSSEVAFFSGTVIEKAKKYGVAVPVNESLYAAIKGIEMQYSKA